MKYDIIIVGAGAAGLVAAYQAIHKNNKLNILVLEKERTFGRKLNASGNGKCNLTNQAFGIDSYFSDSESFIEKWVKGHSHQEVVSFFENLGIILYEKQGYYYPLSNQAKQVSNQLYEKSRRFGVEYRFSTKVVDIRLNKQNSGYMLAARNDDKEELCFEATYVLVATGGYASAKLGGCKDGYKLAKKMNMQVRNIYPVLSPIYVKEPNLSLAKGVRIDGKVSIKWNDEYIMKEDGQIQFNDDNLSGIVMMNASCYLNRMPDELKNVYVYLDTLPQLSWDALKTFFLEQEKQFQEETVDVLLAGLLPMNFVSYLTKRLNLDSSTRISEISEKMWNRITSALKKLEFRPVYKDDFDKAQVTGGGVKVDEVLVDTFETKRYQNLYIVGEVLDVNGKCGGYNLTFAMLSALQAVDDILNKVKA